MESQRKTIFGQNTASHILPFSYVCFPNLSDGIFECIAKYGKHHIDKLRIYTNIITLQLGEVEPFPQDVWNYIVQLTFYGYVVNRPEQFDRNVMKWLKYYTSSNAQNYVLPLRGQQIRTGNINDRSRNLSHARYAKFHLQLLEYNVYRDFEHYSHLNVINTGDFLMGFTFEDISLIESCKLQCFETRSKFDISFSNESIKRCLIDGKIVTYYSANIIDMIPLFYCRDMYQKVSLVN